MILLRREQLAVLNEPNLKRFEDGRVEHITRAFPTELRELGEAGVRALIRQGIAKAQRYAINGEENVELLIDLMVKHGADFEQRPELSWAEKLLRDRTTPEDARLSTLLIRLAE